MIRSTYFVFEDGGWLHRFAQEENDLFKLGVSFEEWVNNQRSVPEGHRSDGNS